MASGVEMEDTVVPNSGECCSARRRKRFTREQESRSQDVCWESTHSARCDAHGARFPFAAYQLISNIGLPHDERAPPMSRVGRRDGDAGYSVEYRHSCVCNKGVGRNRQISFYRSGREHDSLLGKFDEYLDS